MEPEANQKCQAYHHPSSHFGVEEEVGTAAVDVLPHRHLAHRRVVEVVPPAVDRVLAVSCVVPEVDLS